MESFTKANKITIAKWTKHILFCSRHWPHDKMTSSKVSAHSVCVYLAIRLTLKSVWQWKGRKSGFQGKVKPEWGTRVSKNRFDWAWRRRSKCQGHFSLLLPFYDRFPGREHKTRRSFDDHFGRFVLKLFVKTLRKKRPTVSTRARMTKCRGDRFDRWLGDCAAGEEVAVLCAANEHTKRSLDRS